MAEPYRILTLNAISAEGLKRLPSERYVVGAQVTAPDAILLRSHDMHKMDIPAQVKAIGRAGAGTNNIPVAQLSARGVPVFNAPGANANAVKELVIAGMLLAARNLVSAVHFVSGLEGDDAVLNRQVEDGKKQFAGIELAGRTLGVIGLGKIGTLVANAATHLGMRVLGYDPEITVDAAWRLSSRVQKAHSVAEVLESSEFVTLHVPLVGATQHLIDGGRLKLMKSGAVLLNFARDAIVDVQAVRGALEAGRLRAYVCDFPVGALAGRSDVIALPHLGASTREAEDICAEMVVDQVRDFLEHGNILNAVNFPDVVMPRESPFRVGIANANVPNMLGQISTAMARSGLNIRTMINKSKGEMAYTLVDLDSALPPAAAADIAAIAGVLSVRYLPAA